LAQVARQVEQIRNLSYRSPVRARAVTAAEMAQLVRADVSAQAPKALVARTAKAWATIGVIPPRTDLYRAVLEFDTSEVLGFYDPKTRRLVFIGSPSPSAFQRFTLSHELTHALDDQRFDLRHLDQLQNCRDDEQGGYVALAEGDAVLTSVSWAQQHLTPAELLQVEREAGSGPRPPATVPRFVVDLMGFPYQFGPVFVETLQERGGSRAVDDAFRHPPTSTEQVMHPDRFPSDRPVVVEVPDAGSKLGARWKEIEIEQVGEAWLQLMLGQRLSAAEAAADTDHWGGGQYRAWSDGAHTAVVMDTVWDSQTAAADFADGLRRWLGHRTTARVVQIGGSRVRVLFGSDGATLAALSRAVA